MSLTLFSTPVDRAPGAATRRPRRRGRRPGTGRPLRVEALEDRTLLATVTVDVVNFAFSPKAVSINVGDTIHWVWDANFHSTTSVSGIAEQWDSGVHDTPFTFDHTFTTVGSFAYYCVIHGFDNGDGTAGGMSGTITVNGAPILDSIAVTPANPSVPVGETEQFTATGTFSDGSTQDLTNQVTWASATTSVATVSNTSGSQGLATGVATGTSSISAKLSGITGSTVLTVTAAELESIAVTPANPSVPKGETDQFTATGTYSDDSTKDLTTQVTWASATTSVATISNASGSQGLATAVNTGTSTISAALSGISGSTTLTVSAAVLQSIAVTPANPSVPKGETDQFTATGTFSDKSTQNITTQVTWASATASVATISNASGSQGLATAVDTGSSTISAALSGISGSTTLTVTAAVLQSIAVAPVNPSVPKGETDQFTATGTFSDKSTHNITTQVNWASGTTSVATISNSSGTQGLATALTTGTSTISAMLSGISGSTVLTVTAAALLSIAVAPDNPSVPKGETEQFTATGTYSDKSTQDLTTQATWASATTSVATISNASGSQGLATGVATGTSTISAVLSGITGTTVLTVTAATLQSIAVTPANPSVAAGGTEQFTATGSYSDKSTQNITTQVTWASATTSVATISNASGSQGLATAIATGTSTISAVLSGITGTTVLTVSAAVLQSIAVTPANPSVPAGGTEQFTATGTFSDKSTQNITTQVTWASATTSVATISNASGSQGLATAVATGTSTISAVLSGITGTTVLTVSAAVLQSIAVTPANPSVPAGETDQFTATGTYSDKSTKNLTTQVTWASATTSVATISNASGSQGLATAVATGRSSISAALGGITGTTVLTVSAAVLQSIAVTPANPSVSVGGTEQFTATGTYSDKSTKNLTTQVTWASATISVATISNTSGSQGLATAVATGTSSISAALGGVTGTTVLTVSAAVLQSIAVTPANPSVPLGETEQFTATGTYSDKSTKDLTTQVTWASATTSVATISNSSGSQGLATAVATGTSTISAMLDGVDGTTVLTVTAAALQSIAIAPANPTIPLGEVQPFTATGTYSDKSTKDLTSQVTWASANTSVATISNSSGTQGVATSVATGTSTISATLDRISGTTVLTVTPAILEMIMLSPSAPSVAAGDTVQFMAMGMYSDNSMQDLTTQVTWASATTSVATISNASGSQGLATAVANGTSSISAALAGVTGTTVLTVTAAVLQSIELTPANPSVSLGGTEQFTATGTYSDKSTQNLTTQVTWASATTSVATISNASGSQGLATAVATGTSSISAALGGVTGTTVLTVTAAVLQSIALTPANPSIANGTTEQFTATGTYSDKSTQNLTTQVTWASATTSVATISNASGSQGLATAVATGTSSISAVLGGVTGTTVLTVSAAVLQSIAVTPANPSVPLGETEQFTATGTYSDKSTQNLTTQVTWASATTSVATISNSSGTQGVATSVATGTSTISATLDGINGTTVLTVTPATLEMIMLSPSAPSVAAGDTVQFMAMGMYSDNSMQDLTTQVTWASATTSVATISNASGSQGLATGLATGTSTISAALGGITGTTVLTVTAPVLSPVAVRDNSQAGYYQYGPWTVASGGYLGTVAVAAATTAATNRWTLIVPAGSYDIWASWANATSNATNTTYSIYDGFNILGTAQENQQLAAGDGQYGGVLWAKLGTFTVTNGRITVALSAKAANGNIVADGIILTASSPPASPAILTTSKSGDTTSSTTGPMGPIALTTTSGQGQVIGAALSVTSGTAPVQVSNPVLTTAPPSPITVKYAVDSATGNAGSSADHGKTSRLTDHALRKDKARHHQKAHESLIARLAREQIHHKKQSLTHRKGR
jgi:trimeric autotransporter adhesin